MSAGGKGKEDGLLAWRNDGGLATTGTAKTAAGVLF
jgi:hypothetical protein